MRIGLFGGSFNPIHLGHTSLAEDICRQQLVDELWFMVSPCNPLKQNSNLLSDEKRLQLARLAVEGKPHLRVSDFEFSMPRPSYTYDTLAAIEQRYPEHKFTLVIGADNWYIFPRWYMAEKILASHDMLIYPREECPIDRETLPRNVHLLESPILPISSTEIREMIRKGENPKAFLAPEVWMKIEEEGLYRR
jgi:nicotinate-nucleotide adenylyltransferase